VCEDRGEQIDFVGNETVKGDIRHVGISFQFCKDTFLRTASVVKVNDLCGRCCLVGEDDFMGVAELLRDEKIELNRFLGLHSLASPNKEEPARAIPGFWFPGFFEESGIDVTGCPTLS